MRIESERLDAVDGDDRGGARLLVEGGELPDKLSGPAETRARPPGQSPSYT